MNAPGAGESPPAFHVMAKPTGARCNLSCKYCFFLKKEYLYPNGTFRMSDAVLESYIRQTIDLHRAPAVTIAWQGGEPTLMGMDFFKRAVAIEKQYAKPGMVIENTLQTNGTLIDRHWCSFFKENNFLIGLSMDGPRKCHDAFRSDKNGRSVFAKVERAARLMLETGVEFNILCTVNRYNGDRPLEVYRYFRDELRARYIQFIPIVERDNETGNQEGASVTDRSVLPRQYGTFLNTIFDEWVQRDVGVQFVQLFDAVLASYIRGWSNVCVLQARCGQGVALEHTGDVYSCDHYVEPAFRLGNILETPIGQLISSIRQKEFGEAKSATLTSRCRECPFLFACYGECPKNRVTPAKDGSGNENWLCEGLRAFFRHTRPAMLSMAQLMRRGFPAAEIMNAEINRTVAKIRI